MRQDGRQKSLAQAVYRWQSDAEELPVRLR